MDLCLFVVNPQKKTCEVLLIYDFGTKHAGRSIAKPIVEKFITDCLIRYDKAIFVKIVDKIVLTHLLVRDMDKAKAFYTDALGFEAIQDSKWGKGNRGVFVVPPGGGTYIALDFMSEKKEFDTPRNFIISTQDVESAYNEIKAKGVKLSSEIMPYPPGGRFFSVNDPDCNVWNILQS